MLKLNLLRIVENMENGSWELKTYKHWENQPNPGKSPAYENK
jgi:hypothetical protein